MQVTELAYLKIRDFIFKSIPEVLTVGRCKDDIYVGTEDRRSALMVFDSLQTKTRPGSFRFHVRPVRIKPRKRNGKIFSTKSISRKAHQAGPLPIRGGGLRKGSFWDRRRFNQKGGTR